MTSPTTWPNPERVGVPLFPERSGRHHVGDHLLFWYSDIQRWVTDSPIRGCKKPEDFAGDEYHGPVLTPTQIAEMLAGERCLRKVIDEQWNFPSDPSIQTPEARVAFRACQRIIDAIQNLGAAA